MGRTEEEQYVNDLATYIEQVLPENAKRRAAVLGRLHGPPKAVRWATVGLIGVAGLLIAATTFGERVAGRALYEVRMVETTTGGTNVVIAHVGRVQRIIFVQSVTREEAQRLLQTPHWQDAALKSYN